MDVGIRYGDGRWPDLKSTFPLRDAFFPVCSPALLEGMHPLRGPEDVLDLATGRLVRPFGDAEDCELAYNLIQS
jgi:hypothetical protein